ncbi:hypothetical protein GYMLUDRAFT_817257 [Collybiopsis luxurians FD-317 M1]|uniref:Uncharacterized protein n=1 Tax=Collybiopsis luxurians FD-317 M1 TaxID=944289 RepID=A0A0D0C212_9AGAR|nr:hypothetical protein GYMLUDRAFT_817257 [Collybiopsis luxurians FD-317 M1]
MSASQLRFLIIPVACETLVYGIYLCLAATSIIILLKRGLRSSTARKVLFGVVLVMFLSSTGTLWLDIMARIQLGVSSTDAQLFSIQSDIAQAIFTRVNFVLSDWIVVWRCWILWDGVMLPRLFLAICIIGSTVAAIISGALTIRNDIVFGSAHPGPQTLILIVPLVITNICSTSLVGYKAWQHRQFMKENLGRETKSTQAGKVLILLVESGAMYCLLGILAVVSEEMLEYKTTTSGLGRAILSSLPPYLTGIYPTAVILLVTLEKSQKGAFERTNVNAVMESRITTINFARPGSSVSGVSSRASRDSLDRVHGTEGNNAVDDLEKHHSLEAETGKQSSQMYV